MYRFIKGMRKMVLALAIIFSIAALLVLDAAGTETILILSGFVLSLWVSFALLDRLEKEARASLRERKRALAKARSMKEQEVSLRRQALVSASTKAFDDVA